MSDDGLALLPAWMAEAAGVESWRCERCSPPVVFTSVSAFGEHTDWHANQPEPLSLSQKFFSGLSAETRRPSFGEREREFIKVLLIRAEEAGIYNPRLESA